MYQWCLWAVNITQETPKFCGPDTPNEGSAAYCSIFTVLIFIRTHIWIILFVYVVSSACSHRKIVRWVYCVHCLVFKFVWSWFPEFINWNGCVFCWRKCVVFNMFCTILKSGSIVKFQCTKCFSEVFYKRRWTVCVLDLENCKKKRIVTLVLSWVPCRMLSQLKLIYVEWRSTVIDSHETLLFVSLYHDHKKIW